MGTYEDVVDEIDDRIRTGDYAGHWADGFCRSRMMAKILCGVIDKKEEEVKQLSRDVTELQATVARLLTERPTEPKVEVSPVVETLIGHFGAGRR